MQSFPIMLLGLSLLVLGNGCQHAATPSLKMQQQFFSSIKSSNPGEERALRSAQYYQLAGRFDLALKELNTAIASDPHSIRLLNAMGNCHDRLGEYSQAQELYKKILSQESGNPVALNNLGYSCYLAGDLTQAEKSFQEILAKNPENSVARNNLGLVWCRQGKESKALSLWQKNDGEASAREKLHQVLAFLGKPVQHDVTGDPLAKAASPQSPVTSDALASKPEKTLQAEKLARSSQKPVAPRPSALAAADLEPVAVQNQKTARVAEKLPHEAQVKVEEVQMVIQPASYSPPPAGMNSPPDSSIPAVLPPTGLPGKSLLSPTNSVKAKTALIDADLSQIEPESPRRYYRPRVWKRYWRPKMVVYTPREPQKPVKPMQEYINSGQIHRRAAGGPEAAIY